MSLKQLDDEGVNVTWKAWKMPEEANPPAKPDGYKQDAQAHLKMLLTTFGLDITPPTASRNTYLAHVGGKIAAEKGCFSAYHLRIFEAVWKHDENIGDPDVLAGIAQEVGLNPEEFQQKLNDETYTKKVEEDYQSAKDLKIWTIPSYIGSKGELQVHHFKDIPSLEELKKII